MNFELTKHARDEMERRSIPLTVVQSILDSPAQKVPEHGGILCYQSKAEIDGKTYLVRVMVNEDATLSKVVTVYRTSKINKYWKQNESDLRD